MTGRLAVTPQSGRGAGWSLGPLVLLCLLGAILFTALAFRSAAAREKQRIQWLLITLVTSFCCGFASLYLISYDFYLSKFVGGSTNVIFMLLLFYSTVAHHLMDFKLAASLAMSRVLLLVFLASLYFATAPTLAELADKGAIVLVLAHFGRPKTPSPEFSLAQIVKPYEAVLGRPVRYVDWEGAAANVATLQPGDIAVLENTRFFGGEEKNDPAVVDRFAALGDLYDRFTPLLHSVVLRIVGDADDAEEVVEETFWQAWRRCADWDGTRWSWELSR